MAGHGFIIGVKKQKKLDFARGILKILRSHVGSGGGAAKSFVFGLFRLNKWGEPTTSCR